MPENEPMKLELRNHPAQAQHPITKKPLFDEHRKPVPLLKHERAIYLDGDHVGYCTAKPGFPVNLIVNFPDSMRDIIVKFVEDEIGAVSHNSMVPPPPEDRDPEDDDDDDE